MSEPLQKVQSGQRLRIPAAAYNAFVDAARELRSRQQSRSQDLIVPQPSAAITVRVKNASGGDIARFGVLGIDQPLFTPSANEEEFKNRVVLQCSTPNIANHTGKFVIAAAPIADGQIASAFIAGVCVAKVEITSEDDAYADVKDSVAELKTGASGLAQILWKESGTGTGKWAIVRLGGSSSGGGSGNSMEVLLANPSGSTGNSTTQADFVYDVYDLDGTTLIAAGVYMTGNGQRVVNATMTAGTRGRGYIDDGGNFVLTWADETIEQSNCDETAE
jgi:hypothetical protein